MLLVQLIRDYKLIMVIMLRVAFAGDQRLQADHGGDGIGDAGRGSAGGLAGGRSLPESWEKTRARSKWACTVSPLFDTVMIMEHVWHVSSMFDTIIIIMEHVWHVSSMLGSIVIIIGDVWHVSSMSSTIIIIMEHVWHGIIHIRHNHHNCGTCLTRLSHVRRLWMLSTIGANNLML